MDYRVSQSVCCLLSASARRCRRTAAFAAGILPLYLRISLRAWVSLSALRSRFPVSTSFGPKPKAFLEQKPPALALRSATVALVTSVNTWAVLSGYVLLRNGVLRAEVSSTIHPSGDGRFLLLKAVSQCIVTLPVGTCHCGDATVANAGTIPEVLASALSDRSDPDDYADDVSVSGVIC